MGNWASNFRTGNNSDEEEEKRIKKYEETVEDSPFGYAHQDTEDLKKLKWWQYLIFDMRFRLAYALFIGIILGVVVPIAIYFIWFNNSDSTIYGSCLINLDARFQCLINNEKPADKNSCIKAYCCWEENDALPFKCFHSFPSAYQYKVTNIEMTNNGSIESNSVELNIQPNHSDRMTELKININWINENHLNLQIFNPKDYPQRGFTSGKFNAKEGEMNRSGIIINYGDENGYFFLQLARNHGGENETIFDTRLGPINCGKGFISFTTVLPTPYFYGLKGGEGISSKGTVTYGVVNGFENAEMPFYMSLENSSMWHGVLLDTSLPFMMQVLQAPGVGFHLEGPGADINLHIFIGPEKELVLEQLHTHISSQIKPPPATPLSPYIPPYWGLGLHLCRKSTNSSTALLHIQELNEIHTTGNQNGSRKIPYDSDCIDEDLRSPFAIDFEKFTDLDEIVDFLSNNASKKIVLSQKVTIPWNETDIEDIKEMLVMDKTNISDIKPFVSSTEDNQTVYYLDVFHPDFLENKSQFGFDFGNISFSGLNIVNNYPRIEKAAEFCKDPLKSYLQIQLVNGSSVTGSSESLQTRNNVWGSICPNMIHKVISGDTTLQEKTHLEVHNIYGFEALKKFSEIAKSEIRGQQGRVNESILFSSSSGWTQSSYYGGHNGMETAFTWIGLRESLAHVLRQFILSPFSSTPICGSYLTSESPVVDNDLCLRWYQVALLLPFVYHSYGHGNVSRGPLDFPQRYQDYLNQAIRQRYTYAPYYYSLIVKYKETYVPPIVPMSYYFHNSSERSIAFKLVDQFMIGEALMAAPIVKPDLNRETYFPPGIWYEIDGYTAWDDLEQGGFKTVTGHITQTPLFLRGGYILPTLQNPQGNSIMESRAGKYTLLVGLSPNNSSKGLLHIDDGIHSTSPRDVIDFHVGYLDLQSDIIQLNVTITAANNVNCETNNKFSTIIDQIKFLGFPVRYNNITLTYTGSDPPSYIPGDEVDTLRVSNLNMNWCITEYANLIIIAAIETV